MSSVFCRSCGGPLPQRRHNKLRDEFAGLCVNCSKRADNSERKLILQLKCRALLEPYLRKGCVDCGNTNPLTLDFDHKTPELKAHSINSLLKKGSANLKRLAEELTKCEVRCANCHRVRTAQQFGSWRLELLNEDTTNDTTD